MLRKLTATAALMVCATFFSGCGTDSSEPDADAPTPQVIVVFAPGGLGDRCYNDCILTGVTEFKKAHRDEADIYVYPPATLEEGERILSDWLKLPESDIPTLMVLGSGDYMDVAQRQLGERQPTPNKRILVFESADDRGLPVTTFQISTYGASYLAGACAAASGRTPMILLSNPYDKPIKTAGDGFEAGYGDAAGLDVAREYLADDWHGYLMAGEAYRLMDDWAGKYGFIFPIAGGSNTGLYRYSREYPDKTPLLAGVDVDQSSLSTSIVGSVVKNIDILLADYLETWLAGGELPPSGVYGLESGYSDWLLSPRHAAAFGDIVEKKRADAVRKENEYFETADN